MGGRLNQMNSVLQNITLRGMNNVGVTGYFACAVEFLVLTFLLAVSAWTGWQGRSILLALFITFVWSVFSSIQASSEYLDNIYLSLLDLLREDSWLLFLVVFLVYTNFTGQTKILLIHAGKNTLLILICIFLYMLISGLGGFAFSSLVDFTHLTLIRLTVIIVGLIFIENIFQNLHPENRWSVKFIFLV